MTAHYDVTSRVVDPRLGTVIAERYRVLARIGEGGMGTVYAVEHLSLGRKLALKLLHDRYVGDEEMAIRLHREALAASAIAHPNVVAVVDFGVCDGTPFLVMEALDGVDLGALVEDTPLALPRAASIIAQIASGLMAAHAVGIVHRDLKPENIMVSTVGSEDVVKLLDFGISKFERSPDGRAFETRRGVAMGTPPYMAPEALRIGGSSDARSDVFALGVVCFEMLTCTLPRGELEPGAPAWSLGNRPMARLHTRAPGLPVAVASTVDAMLDADPSRRPSLAQIHEVFALHARATPASQPVPARPRVAPRSHAYARLVLAAVAVGVTMGASAATWQRDRGAVANAPLRAPASVRASSRNSAEPVTDPRPTAQSPKVESETHAARTVLVVSWGRRPGRRVATRAREESSMQVSHAVEPPTIGAAVERVESTREIVPAPLDTRSPFREAP